MQALIEVFDCITCHTELQELFHDLASRLRRVVSFDFLYVSLYDSVRNVMRVAAVETTSPVTLPVGLEIPEAESPTGFAWHTQQVVVLDDVDHETRFPITRVFVESGIRRVCLLPLTTAQRRLGAIAFGRKAGSAYSEADLQLLEKATAEVALAVDNHLHSEEANSYEKQLRRERDRTLLLLNMTNALVRKLDLHELFECDFLLLAGDYPS